MTQLDDRIAAALGSLHSGESLVLRPRQGYPGLPDTLGLLSQLSDVPLRVSDLDRVTDLLPPSAGAGPPAGFSGQLLALHTAGSTGAPKCVVYDAATNCAHAEAIAARLGLGGRAGLHIALPPPNYAYGWSIAHSHHHAGVPATFCCPELGLAEVLARVAAEDADVTVSIYLLPQHVPLLLSADWPPADRGQVRRLLVAGGRLSAAAAAALGRAFPRVDELVNMYGQAELGPRLAIRTAPLDAFTEGLVGAPLDGVTISTKDGIVCAASRYAMIGLINSPYRRVETLPPGTPLPTGDIGDLDDAGLWVSGRRDNVITVAGTQVDLQRLSDVLQQRFAPIGLRVASRSTARGARPTVQLVPAVGAEITPRAVRTVLHGEVGGLAALIDVDVVAALSTGDSGK